MKFSSYSLKNLCKELDAKGYSDFLEDFQEFLYDFTSRDFSDARKSYASHIKSCGLSYNDNVTIRNIINKLPDDKIKKYVTDDNSKIVHYHLRRGGKGKVVLFGVEIGMALYLIAVDAKHKILP